MRTLKIVDVDTGDVLTYWSEDQVGNIMHYYMDQDLDDWFYREGQWAKVIKEGDA